MVKEVQFSSQNPNALMERKDDLSDEESIASVHKGSDLV